MAASVLRIHERVHISKDTGYRIITGAMYIAFAADDDTLNFAFRFQKVEQPTFDARNVLNIAPATKLHLLVVEVSRHDRMISKATRRYASRIDVIFHTNEIRGLPPIFAHE